MTALLPFGPNWSSPVRHTLSYLTEILTARSGREQRRALRNAPRRTVEWSSLVTQDTLGELRRAMAVRRGGEFIVADEVRRTTLSSPASSGSSALVLETVPAWVGVGRTLVLVNRIARRRAQVTVSGVAGDTVSLSAPLPDPWPAGTLVHPAFSGRILADVSSRRRTSGLVEVDFKLDVTPASEPPVIAGAAPETFGGLEVFAHRHNWAEPIEATDALTQDVVDYDTGRRKVFSPVGYPTEATRSLHLLKSDADMNAVVGAFHRAKGRRGEFYAPSRLLDLRLAAAVTQGSDTWTVAGLAAVDYDDHPIYRAAQVRFRDGSAFRFKVLGVAAADGNSVLTADVAAPRDVNPEDVLSIAWMPVCRFASDDLVVEWLNDGVARTVVNLVTVESAP